MRGVRTNWTEELIGNEIRRVTGATGSFPSNGDLQSMGLNGLACAISKYGGFVFWADKLGLIRKDSDSDFGWLGEELFRVMCEDIGISAERTGRVKSPYDMLLDGILRVDVKTAKFASYGVSAGWFYRIGKHPQADLIVLLQHDERAFYGLPWWECPTSNVTISRGGGKYLPRLNNWSLIRSMIDVRQAERRRQIPASSVA